MTDNVINFKAAKKRAGYAKKEIKAAENRKKFGRRKSDKRLDDFEKTQQSEHIDAHKLDDKT
ncbi:MAG: DUF4169 family protein [Robiginitomaculum sp.]|nr:DUF4169 family protein [Robiginitomaculum sp.]